MRQPFIALPDAAHRDTVFGLTLAFGAVFGFFYAGSSWLSAFVPWSIDVATPFDRLVPFVPRAALIYVSITPVLCVAPFVLRTPVRMRRLFYSATFATLIGACAFVILPVDATGLAAGARDASIVFQIADAMNLERNYLPSLHVALATLCGLAFGEQASRGLRILLFAWSAAIVASTLLTKQHYVLDVFSGVLLAFWCWRVAHVRAAESRWLCALEIELLCLANFARFSRRHLRYLVISVALMWNSLPRYRANRLLRTGFAFLQTVDDLLDEDRHSAVEPLEVVDRMVDSFEHGEFADDDLSRLAHAFMDDLLSRGGPQALASAIALIRVMQADRRRVLEGCVLEQSALRVQLYDTFKHSVDLMLLASGAPTRSADVPALIEAFAWCSTVRDLEEDLRRGLVNIPREVIVEARITNLRDVPALRHSPVVDAWLSAEAARAECLLSQADDAIAKLNDMRSRRILGMFARSIRRYLSRFPNRFVQIAHKSAISG